VFSQRSRRRRKDKREEQGGVSARGGGSGFFSDKEVQKKKQDPRVTGENLPNAEKPCKSVTKGVQLFERRPDGRSGGRSKKGRSKRGSTWDRGKRRQNCTAEIRQKGAGKIRAKRGKYDSTMREGRSQTSAAGRNRKERNEREDQLNNE